MPKVTWLGHACFLIETSRGSLLVDPFLSGNPAAVRKADDLRPDCIAITHGHADHVGDAVEIARRSNAAVIANFEIATWVGKQGVKRTHAMNTGGTIRFELGQLTQTIAHHTSSLPDGSYGGVPCGLLLRLDESVMYLAGDTGLFYDMMLIGDAGLDLAVLPIGDTFTMGPDDALRAIKLLRPQAVIPSHYNTWELIAQDAGAWAERVRRETTAEPIVLRPGESWVCPARGKPTR